MPLTRENFRYFRNGFAGFSSQTIMAYAVINSSCWYLAKWIIFLLQSPSTLFNHVLDVVLLGAKEKMKRITAFRIVAFVKHLQTFGVSKYTFECHNMRPHHPSASIFRSPNITEHSISMTCFGFSNPRPTLVGRSKFNISPKSQFPTVRIISIIRNKKMVRITASWIFARMANAFTWFKNFPMANLISNSMSFPVLASKVCITVTFLVNTLLPWPALMRGIPFNFIPKFYHLNIVVLVSCIIHGGMLKSELKGVN